MGIYLIAMLFLPPIAQSGLTEDVSFVAECDGSQQKYVLVRPKQMDKGKPLSVLIALHGHGSDRWQFVRHSRDECRAVRDIAAAHGMLLVSPDYRATTSWMGPKAEADVVQIIQAVKKQFPIDRVILSGGSMGGTGALTFAVLHPELVDGVVSLNGTADLVHYKRFFDAIAKSFGGTRAEVPDQYRRRSAMYFPEKFTMPLAATTGGRDAVVPPESVLRLLVDVAKKNPNVLSIPRPQGGHSTNYEDTKSALEFVISRSGLGSRLLPRGVSADHFFREFDKNRDNKLTADEIPAELKDRLFLLDVNHDGYLVKKELRDAEAVPERPRRGTKPR